MRGAEFRVCMFYQRCRGLYVHSVFHLNLNHFTQKDIEGNLVMANDCDFN